MSKTMKILCILLVLAMVISVSACKKTEEGDTTTTTTTKGATTTTTKGATTTTTTAEVDPFAEHLDILFMGHNTYNFEYMDAHKFGTRYLEDKFNITLKYSPCPSYNKPTEFNLIVAAGALPDGGWTCLTIKAPELYQNGYTRLIYKEDTDRLMPEYTRKMAERPLLTSWQSQDIDVYYGLYYVTAADGWSGGFMTGLRLDWMENLGIAPKGNVELLTPDNVEMTDATTDEDKSANKRFYVTDHQYDYEEFVDILRAFVNQDPDQNGEADTYGLATCILEFMDGYWGYHIFPIEGMNFRYVKDPDGLANVQIYSQVYKQFLEMHKALDDEGLMIPDYVTAAVGDVWEWWTAGKAGAIGLTTGYVSGATIPPFSVLYSNPESKVLVIPPTEGRKALDAQFMGGSDIGFFYINANVSETKYERLLCMIETIYYDDVEKEKIMYGIEGTHFFERNELGVPVKPSDDVIAELGPDNTPVYAAIYGHNWIQFEPAAANKDMTKRLGRMIAYEKANWPELEGYYVFYGPGSLGSLAACEFENPDHNELKTNTYKEYVTNLCSGSMDSDTAYERMMSVMNSLGYQEYRQVLNENMYITTELIKGNYITPAEAQ